MLGLCYPLQVNISGYWDVYNNVLSPAKDLAKGIAAAMPSSGVLGARRSPAACPHAYPQLCCVLQPVYVGTPRSGLEGYMLTSALGCACAQAC